MNQSQMLNTTLKKQRKPRKRDIRKLTDVRVPVSSEVYSRIHLEGKKAHSDATRLSTQLLETELELIERKGIHTVQEYQAAGPIVHVKLDENAYQKVVELMVQWNMKHIRVAVHRILYSNLYRNKWVTQTRTVKVFNYEREEDNYDSVLL